MSALNHKCLFIRDVLSLTPSDQDRNCHASVCGVVVDIVRPNLDLHSNRPLIISLDDGTGVVKCVLFMFVNLPYLQNLQLGQCCLVRGTVNVYNNQIQIKCQQVKIVNDVNFETLWINKVLFEKKQIEKKEQL